MSDNAKFRRQADATGRTSTRLADSRWRKMNSPPTGEPWFWLTNEIIDSASWRALSSAGLKVMFRLLSEHMGHAGTKNGSLIVTYADFREYGIRGSSILPAIAEAIELGLIERVEHGRPLTSRSKGTPSTYRLTWLPTPCGRPATFDYRQYKDLDQAREAVKTVREVVANARKKNRLPKAIPISLEQAPQALARTG